MMGLFKRQDSSHLWLFAGLGNPGAEYENNRHNAGFAAVDRIADKYGFPSFRAKFQGHLAEGMIEGQKVVLLKPQTYMNNSGQAVKAAARFYKVPPARVVVFHDEIDLPPEKVKIKSGGGAAGHNGIKSVQAHLGTPDFWRVRIGVGRPAHGDVHDFVLGNFSKQERAGLDALLEALAEAAPLLVQGRMDDAMSRMASRPI